MVGQPMPIAYRDITEAVSRLTEWDREWLIDTLMAMDDVVLDAVSKRDKGDSNRG